jgi:hypothetical protein
MVDDRVLVTTEYLFRDMTNGEFFLDVVVDSLQYCTLGPFATEDERQRVHDDLTQMMRDQGAVDLPVTLN